MAMFTVNQIAKIRDYWVGRPNLLGAPDAEKDVNFWPNWESSIFLPLDRFRNIQLGRSQLVIGRKGSGKSAGRIAAERWHQIENGGKQKQKIISASADQLVDSAIHEFEVRKQVGAAVVSVWYKIFAAEFLKWIGKELGGQPIVGQAEVEVRNWVLSEGFAIEDFGERLIAGSRQLFKSVRDRTKDPKERGRLREENIRRLLEGKNITLFVDDFDNPGDPTKPERLGVRNIQAAIEAADLLSSNYKGPNVSLLIREDLWLRCRVDWHYLDKVSYPLWLQWEAKDLKEFLRLRLVSAAARALEDDPEKYHTMGFIHLWNLFFPENIELDDGSISQGFTYVLRRTMYTPRDIQTFLHLALSEARSFPITEDQMSKNAEEKFSIERMQYLVNEFGTMCDGFSQCLHSFANHSLEWRTSDLRKHLNGQLGQGSICPTTAACIDPTSAVDLMRFLFRIGFLEVRIPNDPKLKDGPYEVRDGLRHPDHWNGARVDDSVKWAVRSTFYRALRAYGVDHPSSMGTGRKKGRIH